MAFSFGAAAATPATGTAAAPAPAFGFGAATTTPAPAAGAATQPAAATFGFGASTAAAAATTTAPANSTTGAPAATTTAHAFGFGAAAASPAPEASPSPAPAAGSTVVAVSGPATAVSSACEDYATLLSCVQDAWSGSVQVDQLRRTILHHTDSMAAIQETRPSAVARAAIQSKNIEMDGIKLNLSDERTVAYILDVSQMLHINELDSLRLVYQSAQSLARTSPEFARSGGADVQQQIKTRAVELFYKRRFNLLTAVLDLILMERTGTDAAASGGMLETDPLARVVGEAVSELVRLGITRNVMSAIEAAHNYPPLVSPAATPANNGAFPVAAAPATLTAPHPNTAMIASYRATELTYLLRILFALFRAAGGAGGRDVNPTHDVASEDLMRLVELLQTRSAALSAAVQAQVDAQVKAAASQRLLPGVAPQPIVTPPQDPLAIFHCYVLLACFYAALECKYDALAGSLATREGTDIAGGEADRTAAASQANADADLAHVIRLLQSKIANGASWQHDVLRCGGLLGWALFLRRVRAIAPSTDVTEEEVQNLVLEGLGGSENDGFWIHLHDQIQTNPAFAALRKDALTMSTRSAAQMTSLDGAVPAANALSPSSVTLAEELGEVLGEFQFRCLVHHGKEMDLLRREDKKTEHLFQKQLARHHQLQQAQHQHQQHIYLQQHGYSQPYVGASLNAAAVPSEPPQPPKLNFSAFLAVLATLARATPSLVPLLWTAPEFETFLAAELHDTKSLSDQAQQQQLFGQPADAASSFQSASTSSIFTSESPFVLLYLNLLAALCVDSLSSMTVYNFVRHCSRVNWEMILINFMQQNLIQNYLPNPTAAQAGLQPSGASQSMLEQSRGRGYNGFSTNPNFRAAVPTATPPQVPPMTPRQLDLLAALLNLLAALLRPSPAIQSLFGQHPDWRVLDTCFALLGLPNLGVHLKARVLECLTSLVRLNATQASLAWERLERSQILPTLNYANTLVTRGGATTHQRTRAFLQLQPTSNVALAPLEGLLFDLEEIENNLQTYPLTTAFLDLLVTLLESAPMPRQLGLHIRNTAPTLASGAAAASSPQPDGMVIGDSLGSSVHPGLYGVTPYTAFATSNVFLNLPHRLYAQPMEQFVLAEACLALFTATVQDFIVELQAESAGGVRIEGEPTGTSASFNARHLSHQFANPNGAKLPAQQQPDQYDASLTPEQAVRQAALQSLAVHPAYALLRDLLASKDLFQQILATLTVSFALLERESGVETNGQPTTGTLHPAVEGTLLASLRFLWTVLEKEEQIVGVLQRIDAAATGSAAVLGGFTPVHGRFTALSSLLLQHQPAILALAKAVGYVQTHAPTSVQQLLAEKTSRALARRRTKGSLAVDVQASPNQSTNQSMYEEEVADETMLAAAASATPITNTEVQTTEVAFYAASALLLLSVRDDSRLVHILEANQATSQVIAAFQRQLTNVQLPTASGANEIQDPDLQGNKARLVLLDVLLSSLTSPSPSTPHIALTLLLLGFDIASPTAVPHSDLLRSPRRDLFDTLFFDLAGKSGFAARFPTLSQSILHLLYLLVGHPLTSAPVLACLKAHPRGDNSVAVFLTRILTALPIVSDVTSLTRALQSAESNAVPAVIGTTGASNQVYQSLFQVSWLLKSLNLHYFLTVGTAARQRLATGSVATEEWMVDEELDQYLVELGFLGESDVPSEDASEVGASDWLTSGANSTSFFQDRTMLGDAPIRASGVRLLAILSNLHTYLRAILPASFEMETPPAVVGAAPGVELARFKYFDTAHNALQYSLSDVYSACLVYGGLSSKEAYAETHKCLEWNIVTGVLGAAKHAFEAWKQTVEVVLLNSSEMLSRRNAAKFEGILVQLLQTLLQKLVAPEDDANGSGNLKPNRGGVHSGVSLTGASLSIWVALGEDLSSLALTVMSKLREVLHLSVAAPERADSGFGVTSSCSSQLHGILSLLVSGILATRHSATRVNLYAIFLNYILYAKERNEAIEKSLTHATSSDASVEESAQQARWRMIQQDQLQLDSQNLAYLSSHNLPLLTLVVNDALDGSAKLRGISFRFLSMMLAGTETHSALKLAARSVPTSEKNQLGPSKFFAERGPSARTVSSSSFHASCLTIFAKNNLLLLFLNQIKANDDAIQTAIHASGARALHQYDLLVNLESCLSFFLQLAMTAEGAQMMVEYQLVRILTSLKFLAARPTPSGQFAGEYEHGMGGVGAAGVPSPFEKHQSIYLLVLQLLVQLLQSLPTHAVLVQQVQRFLDAGHEDLLVLIAKDTLAVVTSLSLRILSTALSLLYQMVKEERVAASLTGADAARSAKLQKLANGGVRQIGNTTYEMTDGASEAASVVPTFTRFVQKHQSFLTWLLPRYGQPQSSTRLRAYLSAQLRTLHASQGDRFDPSVDLLLERGDATMQTIFRKVLALLVCQIAPTAASGVLDGIAGESQLVFFGPHLGDGGDSALYTEDGLDAHNPSTPQLELLLSILHDNHARLQLSHRQVYTLRKNLEQLALAANGPTASGAYPDLNSGAAMGASNVASSIAALELQYFPPSAASTFFQLDATQRVRLLQQRLQEHLALHTDQIEKHIWNIEHALMLCYHHVRMYLPSSGGHRSSQPLASRVTPADFRAHAESTLLPLLATLAHTIQSTTTTKRDEAGLSDALALYQPAPLIDQIYQARLAAASTTPAASFIGTIVARINKLVRG